MQSNAILFSMLCALLGWSARGQVTTSSIYGTVTDSTGGRRGWGDGHAY
jgi:hypothetical protein